MQIVELDIGAVSGLQHLDLHHCGNRLHLLGRDQVQKPVHQRAPCPEAVMFVGSALFGQPGHRALKGVAVAVNRRGQKDAGTMAIRRGIRPDRFNSPIGTDVDSYIVFPPIGRKSLLRPNRGHRDSPFDKLLCADIKQGSNSRQAANPCF